MRRTVLAALVPVAVAVAVTGCGSSNHTTSPAASAPVSTSSSSASTSSYSGGSAPSTTSAALITTKHVGKLGKVLAFGPKRMTVYLFEADKGGGSSCMGACERVWPPVIGSPKAIGGAMSSELGTVTRPDGAKQVTYKGHPLYLYIKDKDNGDTYGEGVKSFGAEWYALSPSGNKVDLS